MAGQRLSRQHTAIELVDDPRYIGSSLVVGGNPVILFHCCIGPVNQYSLYSSAPGPP